ncbi:uncharacterized protein [Prorops nasuta]|uniref:uncharacterized protein n=1 Tax=Prorops nasuta TaxID=863751 RepID=UPI0034CF6447
MEYGTKCLPTFNKSFVEDTKFSVQPNRLFLLLIGAWPQSNHTSRIFLIVSYVLRTVNIILFILLGVPCILEAVLGNFNMESKLMLVLSPAVAAFSSNLKYLFLLFSQKDIHWCIQQIENDWRFARNAKEREIMLNSASKGRYITAVCAIWANTAVFLYLFMFGNKMSITTNGTTPIKHLPIPFYRGLLETETSPNYEIILALQLILGFVINCITISSCSLAAVLVTHANGQFKLLMDRLRGFVDEYLVEKKEKARKKLANIVESHLRILRYASCIENIINPICFVEVISCTLLICFLGYSLLKEWEKETNKYIIPYGILFISYAYNIFIFCYIGELLSEKCVKVGDVAYAMEWYLLPRKTAQAMILIISRSNVACKITAGKFIVLTLSSFAIIIKTAFVYLNMLRTSELWSDKSQQVIFDSSTPTFPITLLLLIETDTGEIYFQRGFPAYKKCKRQVKFGKARGKVLLWLTRKQVELRACASTLSKGRPARACYQSPTVYSLVRMLKNSESIKNKSYFRDWSYSIRLNRWFLTPLGLWPLSLSSGILEKSVHVVMATISSSLITFVLVPGLLRVFLDNQGDILTKVRLVGPVSYVTMAALKHYVLIHRNEDIGRCIMHIYSDWKRAFNVDSRQLMLDNAKFGRYLIIICTIFMYGGGIFFVLIRPYFGNPFELVGNVTVRALNYPIYRKLMDPRTTPYYEIVQTLQTFSAFVIFTNTINGCGLAAAFVMHACGQFQILSHLLDNLVDGSKEDFNTTEERFAIIIDYHLRILNFITQIEDILQDIFLVELVGCTLNICFLGYQFMKEWEHSEPIGTLTFCLLLLSFTFNIFILCYIGEILMEQCKKIGETSYMIEWYRITKKTALGLILIITTSNSSPKLTAGKFAELSLSTFCSVLKSSVAYFNILRTITES